MVRDSASCLRSLGTVVVLFFLANAIAVGTAQAEEKLAVIVSYHDLNLASEEGSRVLYERLVSAARQVCPEKSDTALALRLNRDAEQCVADAVERAVRQVRNPRFVELAAAKGH